MDKLDIDSISLEQALIDFEVANARVIDLTHRLTTLSQEVLALRSNPGKKLPRAAERYELLSDADAKLRMVRNSRALKLVSFFAPKLRRALSDD